MPRSVSPRVPRMMCSPASPGSGHSSRRAATCACCTASRSRPCSSPRSRRIPAGTTGRGHSLLGCRPVPPGPLACCGTCRGHRWPEGPRMSTARASLVALREVHPDQWPSRAELEPLWLRAANERLAQQRERIPVLGRVADDVGLVEIQRLDDLVPLLFAHSNYKSYPETFIAKGRWDLMNKWLDTLSSVRVDNVDVEGVRDQDDWVDRLHAAGHKAYVTSGTTGKNSFLPQMQVDEDLSLEMLVRSVGREPLFAGGERRPVFIFGPKYGHHRAALQFRALADRFGRPDETYFLTEEPMRIAEITRMGDLRRRIAEGTAMPSEIAALERETAARQDANAQRLDLLMDALIAHRHEPMYVVG